MDWRVACLVIGWFASSAAGLRAQTLQLPTFSSFATSTSVLVPDRGSASLGSIQRSTSGSNQFGPGFGGRSFGSDVGAGSATVSVQIHDFEAYDELLLGEAARQRGSQRSVGRAGARVVETLRKDEAGTLSSVAEIRRRQAQESDQRAREVADLIARAERAEQAGKENVARMYRQMAARQSASRGIATAAEPSARASAGGIARSR